MAKKEGRSRNQEQVVRQAYQRRSSRKKAVIFQGDLGRGERKGYSTACRACVVHDPTLLGEKKCHIFLHQSVCKWDNDPTFSLFCIVPWKWSRTMLLMQHKTNNKHHKKYQGITEEKRFLLLSYFFFPSYPDTIERKY